MSVTGNTQSSRTEDNEWITLTDKKSFSRLLYTNPVCFLSSVSTSIPTAIHTHEHIPGKRNVMVLSWLTATNNSGNFIFSLNKKRHTASHISQCPLSGGMEFVLSVPVKGMEDLVLGVGRASGRWGSKFPEDHVTPPAVTSVSEILPSGVNGVAAEDDPSNKKKKRQRKFLQGVPGLEAIALGNISVPDSETIVSSSDQNTSTDDNTDHNFAIAGTVAHMKCETCSVLEGSDDIRLPFLVDKDHYLVSAKINQAYVHRSYWDCKRNMFRPEVVSLDDESAVPVPPYLTFFGSQTFGYVSS